MNNQYLTVRRHRQRLGTIGVRGGRAGGARGTPPPKKFNQNTKKNENSWKLREQPFAEEFSEMGVGLGCRVVGKLLGKSVFVGNGRWFCLGGFSFIFVVVTNCIVLYFCRISVTIVNVAVQFLNDPRRPLCWRASQQDPADHRLIHCYQLLHFAVVHGLVITFRFWFNFGSESSSPRRFFGITQSFKVTRKRLKCLENAFPAINFFNFLEGGAVWASCRQRTSTQSCRESMPVPPQIDFTPYAYVRYSGE